MMVAFREKDVGKCQRHKYFIYDNAEKALWFMEKHVTRVSCTIEFCTECQAYHIVPVTQTRKTNG